MDAIYQSLKNLFKAFISIFVALVDLISGLLNGIAYVLGKLKPNVSERFHEIGRTAEAMGVKDASEVACSIGAADTAETTKVADKSVSSKYGITFSGKEEILVSSIRSELKEKVTSKEKYYYLHAYAEGNGGSFYFIVLSILVFALFASTMLYSVGSSGGTRMLAAVIMAVLCAAACVAIARYRRNVMRKRIMKLILEEEFKDLNWKKEEQHQKQQEESNAQVYDEAKSEADKNVPDNIGAKIHPISEISREEIG